MKRFNEQPSPKTTSRRIQTLQILARCKRLALINESVLGDLRFTEDDLTACLEQLFQAAIDAGELEECGCCGGYHRPDFHGDCRNDDERFPNW